MPALAKAIDLGGVNCYLLSAGDGYVLVDTGFISKRRQLEDVLEGAGCVPGTLKLIVQTHGDSDHADNSAYLRRKYGCRIAMHRMDSGMVERGDMSWNRKPKADKYSLPFRIVALLARALTRGAKFETFTPDVLVDDGYDLSAFGLDATVVHLPGHSKGSIGVLTRDGELFCGDFVYTIPGMGFIDDLADHRASMAKLERLPIAMVYPGHGKPLSKQRMVRKG